MLVRLKNISELKNSLKRNYARTPASQELMDLADKAIEVFAKERADDLHNEINYYDKRGNAPRIEVINNSINHGAFTKKQIDQLQSKLDAHEEWAQKELARARLTIIVATGTTRRTQEDIEDGKVYAQVTSQMVRQGSSLKSIWTPAKN